MPRRARQRKSHSTPLIVRTKSIPRIDVEVVNPSRLADYVQIHQPSLSVTSDETVKLSCEIQYGTKVDRKLPTLFWFEDVHQVIHLQQSSFSSLFLVLAAQSCLQ